MPHCAACRRVPFFVRSTPQFDGVRAELNACLVSYIHHNVGLIGAGAVRVAPGRAELIVLTIIEMAARWRQAGSSKGGLGGRCGFTVGWQQPSTE